MRKDRNMKKIKIGIVGLGSMGTAHRLAIESLDDFELAAICDIEESKLKDFKDRIPCFTDYPAMLAEAALDAVTVATPHWFHPEIGAAALDAGKHVLIEKPIGVHVSHARKLLDAIARHPELKAAAMFNQRRIEAHRRLKSLIDGGELGKILRINWIITDWFRTQRYYDSGDWRASWRGEGGGVLINQCPHNLDLWQWICGMPNKVRAFCHNGKWHDIEVEDDVTAYVEYPNGATGVFVTTTSDAPGTNRFEIDLDKGQLVCDGKKLIKRELSMSIPEFHKTYKGGFGSPEVTETEVETDGENLQHVGVLRAFTNKILGRGELIADGAEGVNGLTISNAMHLSSWLDKTIELPLDEDLFLEELNKRRATSRLKKNVEEVTFDTSSSYAGTKK